MQSHLLTLVSTVIANCILGLLYALGMARSMMETYHYAGICPSRKSGRIWITGWFSSLYSDDSHTKRSWPILTGWPLLALMDRSWKSIFPRHSHLLWFIPFFQTEDMKLKMVQNCEYPATALWTTLGVLKTWFTRVP